MPEPPETPVTPSNPPQGSSAPTIASAFTFTLEGGDGYRQTVDFGLEGVAPFVIDEPPPIGDGTGPTPSRVLAASLAACLGASLLFCLRKARVDVSGLRTSVEGRHGRNEQGRLRLREVRVRLEPVIPVEQHEKVTRCVEIFEDFCVVTASVRPAIDVTVEVVPQAPKA